jgi:membrane protease YdiL (CAAX protease family)
MALSNWRLLWGQPAPSTVACTIGSGEWPMLWTVLRAAALTLLLYLAVYLPAFALVFGLRLSMNVMVPVLMASSLAMACLLMAMAIRRGWLSMDALGWCWPDWHHVLYAVLLSGLLSPLVSLIEIHLADTGMLGGLHYAPWQMVVCFLIAAPIQEEAVFRGLLQSSLARNLTRGAIGAASAGVGASITIAVLFGAVHLRVAPVVVAVGATVLGLLTGELKRRSGSLLPGMLCHALFNLGGMLLSGG